MEIVRQTYGNTVKLIVSGRLDTITAADLEKEIEDSVIGDVDELILDLSGLRYISSSGLRVLLISQKKMNHLDGRMHIEGVIPEIAEILKMTGFDEFLEIEVRDHGTES